MVVSLAMLAGVLAATPGKGSSNEYAMLCGQISILETLSKH